MTESDIEATVAVLVSPEAMNDVLADVGLGGGVPEEDEKEPPAAAGGDPVEVMMNPFQAYVNNELRSTPCKVQTSINTSVSFA